VTSVVNLYVNNPNAKGQKRTLFARHILRKIFLEDWAMKLTALVITFGLWFGVTGLSTPATKRFTSVPLNISGPDDAEITTPQSDIEIVVSGDKRKLDQINKPDLTANIDVTDMPAGERVVSLMPENVVVNLPDGVKLVEVFPIRIPVKMETIVEKEIEVRAKIGSGPPAGFEVYGSAVLPQKMRVRGPAGFINTLEFVETAEIDLSDRREGFTARQVPVTLANQKAAVQTTVVDVAFRIGERRVERRFTMPVALYPDLRATFVLYGPRSILLRARADQLTVEYGTPGDGTGRVILPPEWADQVEVRDLRIE